LLLVIFAIGVLVKVLEVLSICKLWNPWRLNSFVLYDLPVYSLEPIDCFDVFATSTKTSEALGQILLKKTCNQRSSSDRDVVGKLVVPNGNSSVNIIRVLIVERRISKNELEIIMKNLPREHFVKENAKCPPVNSVVMSLTHNDFWCKILRSTTERVASIINLFGEAKVSYL